MSPLILLQGGTVLVPDGETDGVVPVRKDVLIIGDRIAGIDDDIDLAAHGISAADIEMVDLLGQDCNAWVHRHASPPVADAAAGPPWRRYAA